MSNDLRPIKSVAGNCGISAASTQLKKTCEPEPSDCEFHGGVRRLVRDKCAENNGHSNEKRSRIRTDPSGRNLGANDFEFL
jgi:hypothetical protein